MIEASSISRRREEREIAKERERERRERRDLFTPRLATKAISFVRRCEERERNREKGERRVRES